MCGKTANIGLSQSLEINLYESLQIDILNPSCFSEEMSSLWMTDLSFESYGEQINGKNAVTEVAVQLQLIKMTRYHCLLPKAAMPYHQANSSQHWKLEIPLAMKAMLKNARFPVTSWTNRALVRPVVLNKFQAAATASVCQH